MCKIGGKVAVQLIFNAVLLSGFVTNIRIHG